MNDASYGLGKGSIAAGEPVGKAGSDQRIAHEAAKIGDQPLSLKTTGQSEIESLYYRLSVCITERDDCETALYSLADTINQKANLLGLASSDYSSPLATPVGDIASAAPGTIAALHFAINVLVKKDTDVSEAYGALRGAFDRFATL